MASDGDLNVGISSEDELNAFVSEKRGQGTYLSVLGFGSGNYQDAKMETLADYGNGSYHYIDSADEAARVYERFLAAGASSTQPRSRATGSSATRTASWLTTTSATTPPTRENCALVPS